jgi:predicted nucleic acid-binding protein
MGGRAQQAALSVPDGYIAAIAAAHGYAVATRDMAPFATVGVKTINLGFDEHEPA